MTKRMHVHLARAAQVLALAAPARAAADDHLPVKAVALAEQEMRDDGKHVDYRFPLTLAEGVDAADLKAHTTRVSRGAHVDPGLLSAFTASVQVLPEAGPALVVRVDFDLAAEPVTYDVDVALAGSAPGSAAQHVTVRLAHPAAKLRPRSPLLVNGSWPLFLGLGRSPREIVLEEASRRSRLSRISIEQQEAPLSDGRPVDGRIVFALPEEIAPGSFAAVPMSLEGSFPVGTTRGRVEVQATQLEQAVVLDYELRVRVTSLAIPFVFLVGAGGGNLLRDRLKKREERLERDLRARDLRARLERLAARSGPEDRAALLLAARDLAQEAGEEQEPAITRGSEILAKALAERATRQRAIVAETSRELALLGQGWLLPPALDLAPLRQVVEEAQQRAVEDDLTAAGVAMNDARTKARELVRGARAWALDMTPWLAKLEEARLPGDTELAAALLDVREALAAVREVKIEESPEPLLRALHAANEAAIELLRRSAPTSTGPVAFGMDEEGDEDASELVEPRTGRRRTARGPQPPAHGATSVLVLASPAAEEEVRDEVDRELRGTRAARTAISAVVLAVLTWALYEHDFFGTAREMVSLFALGFTTDLSTDALFAALEKAKRA